MTFSCLVEDTYGEQFWNEFFKKKIHENNINISMPRKIRTVPKGLKLNRLIRNFLISKDEFVLLIFDADCKELEQAHKNIKKFIDNEYLDRVRFCFFDYEIEEWICYALNIKYNNQKPSIILKNKTNYQKNKLYIYAKQLDCSKLQECPSFKRFLEVFN